MNVSNSVRFQFQATLVRSIVSGMEGTSPSLARASANLAAMELKRSARTAPKPLPVVVTQPRRRCWTTSDSSQ